MSTEPEAQGSETIPMPSFEGVDVPPGWMDALKRFFSSTQALQESYESLKEQVQELNLELSETNEELKRNLDEKERLRSYLGHILEGLSVGVVVTDLQGRVTLINRAARSLVGLEQEPVGEDLSKMLSRAMPGEDARAMVFPAKNRGAAASEHRVKGADGETLNLAFRSRRLLDSAGVELGALVTVEDLTELRSMQEEVARSQRLAAMGEMAVSIAHEVRNPLGSVHLFATLMAQEPTLEGRESITEKIHAAIGAVDNILTNLLTFARPMRPKLSPLDPGPVLSDCLDFVRPLAGQKSTTVTLKPAENLPRVEADGGLLKQAVLNLLLNALQAMPGGGELTASIRRVDEEFRWLKDQNQDGNRGWLEIGIEDTGEGIPDETLARVFDPFFTTRPEGTGLGLTIVHNIMKAHQGRVNITSRPGEGTCVRLRLPLGNNMDKNGS